MHRMALGVLEVPPGQGLPKGGLDGLSGFQFLFRHPRPLHHAPDQPRHVQNRRDKQALLQGFFLKGQHTEPGPDAVSPQGNAAPAGAGIGQKGFQLRDHMPGVKGVLLPLPAAVLRQIRRQHLPAPGADNLRKCLSLFLVPALAVDKQKHLVGLLPVQNSGDIADGKEGFPHEGSPPVSINMRRQSVSSRFRMGWRITVFRFSGLVLLASLR